MGEHKSVAVRMLLFAAVAVILVAVGLMFFFGRNHGDVSDNDSNPIVTEENTGNNSQGVEVGVYKDSILRSTNSGSTFETYFKIATSTKAKLGVADVLSIAFHPTKRDVIVVTTYDDGLFLNKNRLNEWTQVAFPPKQIYSFILDRSNPERIFASGVVSNNGRIFRTEDEGKAWRAVYAEPGTGTYVSALAQDPQNQNLILAGTNVGTIVRSTDGGDTWKNVGGTISGVAGNFSFDSTLKSFAYLLMKKGKVYYSRDGGVSWSDWEEVKMQEIRDLNAYASKLSSAGDRGGATAARDQATALQERNRTERTPSNLLSIVADPNKTGVVYASATNGLYRSVDYGKFWKKINIIESAEKFPIPSIAISPSDSNEISFVSGKSFYRSTNNGATWAVVPLDNNRDASFIAYNPLDTSLIFIGMSGKD